MLKELFNLSEAAEPSKDALKAASLIKRKLTDRFKKEAKENVDITVTPDGNSVVVRLEFNRVLSKNEYDFATDDVIGIIEKCNESGLWKTKDSGSYFADISALQPRRGMKIEGGSLLCDIEITVMLPVFLKKAR